MSWTKRQIIEKSFEKIGLAQYVYDMGADVLQSALHDLDSMVASWEMSGITLGYSLPNSPNDSDIDSESNIPDVAINAVTSNLAIQLAPSRGKIVSRELKSIAKKNYDLLLIRFNTPPTMSLPRGTVRGSGTKYWRNSRDPFLPKPDQPITTGNQSTGGQLEYN